MMITPFDIHTHQLPKSPSRAMVNIRFPELALLDPHGYYSVGIHPWDSALYTDNPPHWDAFRKLASNPRVLAVGECGLDRLVHPSLLALQEELFVSQVLIANEFSKPIVIHQVRAFDLLQRLFRTPALAACAESSAQPLILHGFRGNATLAEQWLSWGGYLSFGRYFNEEAVFRTPMDRLFIETDDGAWSIEQVYERIASVRQVSCNELVAQVDQNIQQVFFCR